MGLRQLLLILLGPFIAAAAAVPVWLLWRPHPYWQAFLVVCALWCAWDFARTCWERAGRP